MLNRVKYGARYLSLRARGIKWLFVLGHMRAGSSLLVHLLNSNQEVVGYGETHLKYKGRRSLVDLHDNICETFSDYNEQLDDYRYVMDKILHPYIWSDCVLRVEPLKCVVIVRNPINAIPSILDVTSHAHVDSAIDYYRSSLRRIDQWLSIYNRNYAFVDYERLLTRPDGTLQSLSNYLSLSNPLKSEYETMWSTGRGWIGDSSDTIQTGQITKEDKSYSSKVSQHDISRAMGYYKWFVSKHE